MTTYRHLLLYAFFIQVTRGMPATVTAGTATPYGAQFQSDFNNNLAAVWNNLNNGAVSLATPPIKLGVETMPNIIQQGVTTATDKANKIAAAGIEGFQKMGVGMGKVIGNGAVLGSSVAGGAMQVAGHGLGVGVDAVDAGAKAGIDLLGHVGDNAASSISVGTTIGGSALSTLGNGMLAAGTGVNVMSNGMSTLLDMIGATLSTNIIKAEQVIAGLMDAGVLKLENGALSFSSTAQANVYNILNSFLQILVNVQKLFDGLRLNINANVTPGVAGATGTAAAGTAAGTTTGQTTTPATGQTTTPATGKSNRLTDKLKQLTAIRDLGEPEGDDFQSDEIENTSQTAQVVTSDQSEEVTTAAFTHPLHKDGQPKVEHL